MKKRSHTADPVSRHVESFLEMLVAERGLSGNTLDAYSRDLSGFEGFLTSRGMTVESAGPQAIRDYLAEQMRLGMASRTTARRLSAIRQFFKFLFAEDVRRDDPALVVDSPRQGRVLPKVLSEEDVDLLLSLAQRRALEGKGRKGGAEDIRLVALLEILYAAGLRVSELVGLPLSALGRDHSLILVRGKGGRERMVPLSDPAGQALADYLAVRDAFLPRGKGRARGEGKGGDAAASSPWLFPSRGKRPPHPSPLRPDAETTGGGCRHGRGQSVSPCSSSCLCHPSPQSRRRSAQRSENAGPRRYHHHPDLHPCADRTS